jgi:rubredoxin
MPVVVALSEIPADKVNQPGSKAPGSPGSTNTTFFRAKREAPDAPTAALNRYPGGISRYSAAHFHEVDQFQIIMEGSGEFGRHHVQPYCVHFSRAYTPYGPLQSNKDTGWAFMVLRSRFDSGAQRFPAALEKLKQIRNRQPWQVTAKVTFPEQTDDVNMNEVPQIKDQHGLFTRTVTMLAGARTVTPDPAMGDGQYVVAVKGSLMYQGKERPAPAVVFLGRNEPPFELLAGNDGLEAIILNFPRLRPREATEEAKAPVTGFRVLQCTLCAFVYDEEAGLPVEGIAPGTRWEDVPESWSCPDCSAKKRDFQMVEI